MRPSLVAFPLPEAIEALERAGETLGRVLVTGPPGAGRGEGVPRVVREQQSSEGVVLTVASPMPGPRRSDAG